MFRRPLVFPAAALLLAACGIASAQNAYTARPMNVHAGPDREYPLVAQLDSGAPLDVHGCLSDWSWCDVSFGDDGDNRGWVYADGVSFVYQGERVPLYSYGPSLGLPIVTFSLGVYWDDYYRGRPWYAQRSSWAHRRMPPHMRPPGRQFAGPPPMPNRRPGGGQPEARGGEHGHAMPQEQRGGRAMPSGPTRQTRPPERGDRAMPSGPTRQTRPPERGDRAMPSGPTRQTRPPERGDRAMPSGPSRQVRPPEQNAHGAPRGHAPEQKRPPSHGNSEHGDHGNRPPASDH